MNNIQRCQVHNEASDTFCETCKRISCPMCEECMKHKGMSIDKFVNKYKAHLKPAYLKDYKDAARKASEMFTNTIANNDEVIPVLEDRAKELQEAITNSEEGRARDFNLITEATQHLRDIQVKAFTNTLKEVAEEAIHTLDVSERIQSEVSKYNPELERQKAELSKMKQQSEELTWELEWLDTITRAEGDELDEEVKLATSLCIVNDVIERAGLSPIILAYEAFPGVCEVFNIKKALKQELVDVGNGVRMSKPITVRKGFEKGYDIFSSLSHNGVLAMYFMHTDDNPFGDMYPIFQLTDLVNGRHMKIKKNTGRRTNTGFYDDSMVMLTDGMPLGVCSVGEMFSKKNMSVLKRIGDVGVYPFTDVSLLHSTRVLLFTSTSRIPHEYNVDTGMIRMLDIKRNVLSFASLTGIDIGVKSVFVECGDRRFTYSLNNDYSTSLVLGCEHGDIQTFIPSSSDPRDLNKGMKIYTGGLFLTNTTEKAYLTTKSEYGDSQLIVRLYQDIFLTKNLSTEKWCLVRIFVP